MPEFGSPNARKSRMTTKGCVVLVGDFSHERPDLTSIGKDFCWAVIQTPALSAFPKIAQSRNVIAVLVQTATLEIPWQAALQAIKQAAPQARVILCHTGEKARLRSEMVEAGAFGVLLSPLAHAEVRQSLGFVWASASKPRLVKAPVPLVGVA